MQYLHVSTFKTQPSPKHTPHTPHTPRERELPPEHYTRTPGGDCFVRADVAKGILPEILEELLSARKRARQDLKAASDPFVKAVLDGRQLALKVCGGGVRGRGWGM